MDFTAKRPMLHLACLLAGSLLAGCQAFDFDSPFSAPKQWSRQGAAEDQAYDDLRSCKTAARATIARDASIDSHIDSRDVAQDTHGYDDTSFDQSVSDYQQRKRFDRLVAECMRRQGYAPQTKQP